jgi:predicted enzyme related to lactoylglutathione lyase
MPRPVHFELPAENPARAQQFYVKVFGWQFQKWEGPMDYWMVATGEGEGINGGMGPRAPGFEGPVNVIDVPDLDAYVQRVTDAGGSVAAPKMAIPTVGWLAYVNDTEGNMLGLMQFDAGAA